MEMRYEINADILKQLSDVIMVFDNEVKITIDKDKWAIKTVDPEHVKMADIEIPNTVFDIYSNGYDDKDMVEPVEIGIDLVKLNAFLKVFNATQRKKTDMGIDIDTERGTITYSVGNLTRKTEMLDTTHMNDPTVPDANLHVRFDTTVQEILRTIRAAKPVTDYLVFTTKDGYFQINAVGDTDTDVYDFPDVTISDEYYKTMYSMNHLWDIFKSIKRGDIHISTATDYPMKIEHTNDAGIEYTLLLAPRIEADDDHGPTPQQQETEEPEEVQETPGEITEEEPIPEEGPEPEPEPETDEIEIEILAEDIQIGEQEEEPTEPVNIADDLTIMGDEHNENPDTDDDDTDDDKTMIVNVNTNEVLELIRKGHSGYWVRNEDGTEEFWRFEHAELQQLGMA